MTPKNFVCICPFIWCCNCTTLSKLATTLLTTIVETSLSILSRTNRSQQRTQSSPASPSLLAYCNLDLCNITSVVQICRSITQPSSHFTLPTLSHKSIRNFSSDHLSNCLKDLQMQIICNNFLQNSWGTSLDCSSICWTRLSHLWEYSSSVFWTDSKDVWSVLILVKEFASAWAALFSLSNSLCWISRSCSRPWKKKCMYVTIDVYQAKCYNSQLLSSDSPYGLIH